MYDQCTIGASLHHYYVSKWFVSSIIILYKCILLNEVTVKETNPDFPIKQAVHNNDNITSYR